MNWLIRYRKKISFLNISSRVALVTCLMFIIALCDSCELSRNSDNATASHLPGVGYNTYSCIPCTPGPNEVHVIDLWKPHLISLTNQTYTVPLQIKSDKAVDVKLVLISRYSVDWEITKSNNVNILSVHLKSDCNARLNNSTSVLEVHKDLKRFFEPWKNICELNDYVMVKFGHMSTFTSAGINTASSWNLTVGTCDSLKPSTVSPHGITYQECLIKADCLLKYPFLYDDSWNECHGDQYVTTYKDYYVGVILCTTTKYKIFLSESLSEMFLNVGDQRSFRGWSHCEFIGAASPGNAYYGNDTSPNVTGYYRSSWGAHVLKGFIGGTLRQSGIFYPQYYRCGICIPGSRIVIDHKGTDFTHQMETETAATTTTPTTTIAAAVVVTTTKTTSKSTVTTPAIKMLEACSSDCWMKYSFTYDNNWNSCFGDQYVTTYEHYYVGVIRCSSKRYKLFMSESLTDKFLNIADTNGYGQDHCEFIGASSDGRIELPGDFLNSPPATGYYRSEWGEAIQKGQIGVTSTGMGKNKYYVKWYECGLSIPGSKQVFNHDGTVIATSSPSTNSKTSDENVVPIIGLVVGVIAAVAVIFGMAVLVVVLIRKQTSKPSKNTATGNQNVGFSAGSGNVTWQQNKNSLTPKNISQGDFGHNISEKIPNHYYQGLKFNKQPVLHYENTVEYETASQCGSEGHYLDITEWT